MASRASFAASMAPSPGDGRLAITRQLRRLKASRWALGRAVGDREPRGGRPSESTGERAAVYRGGRPAPPSNPGASEGGRGFIPPGAYFRG
jgi:hypothetical protein